MNREALRRAFEAEQGNMSILLRRPGGDTLLEREADRTVVSASTIKTPLMLCVLEEVRRGGLSLEERIAVREVLPDSLAFEEGPRDCPLRELLAVSIVNSDNTAANLLIDLIGMERFNAYCREMGWGSTRIERRMLDWESIRAGRNNYTSAADQYQIFRALWERSILTPGLCETALDILRRQRSFELALRYLPFAEAAHKTGTLSRLRHDCGLFLLGREACFFGFFLSDCEDGEAERKLGRLGRLAWNYLREESV